MVEHDYVKLGPGLLNKILIPLQWSADPYQLLVAKELYPQTEGTNLRRIIVAVSEKQEHTWSVVESGALLPVWDENKQQRLDTPARKNHFQLYNKKSFYLKNHFC